MAHTHTYTCSEQSLRILMRNASYVQKHSNYTWQEWVGEKTREIRKVTIAMSWSVHGPLRCWRICASSLLGRKTLSNCQCTLPNSLSHDQWFHCRKFRSTISFCALVVDFRGHQLANLIGAMACDNLLENLGVKYPVILGKLRLQWVVLRLMPSRIHSWHWNTGCRCCVSICGHRIGAMRWGGSRKP